MRKFLAACMAIVMIFMIAGCSSEGHEGEVKTPSGSSIQKGKDYQKVVDEFESSGFTNIKLENLTTLLLVGLQKTVRSNLFPWMAILDTLLMLGIRLMSRL